MKHAFVQRFCALLLVLGMMPVAAQAHLAGGEDKDVGEYMIDFGYDPEVPHVGDGATLAFDLHKAGTMDEVAFTSVWVRISDDAQILTATHIPQDDAGTNLLYTFPHEGEYTIRVQFSNDEGVMAETDFTLVVPEAGSSDVNGSCTTDDRNTNTTACVTPDAVDPTRERIWFAAIFVVGMVVGMGIHEARKRRSSSD